MKALEILALTKRSQPRPIRHCGGKGCCPDADCLMLKEMWPSEEEEAEGRSARRKRRTA